MGQRFVTNLKKYSINIIGRTLLNIEEFPARRKVSPVQRFRPNRNVHVHFSCFDSTLWYCSYHSENTSARQSDTRRCPFYYNLGNIYYSKFQRRREALVASVLRSRGGRNILSYLPHFSCTEDMCSYNLAYTSSNS